MNVSQMRPRHLILKRKCDQHARLNNFTAEEGVVYCNTSFDGFICWPVTEANTLAVHPCPKSAYTSETDNSSRMCFSNGSWDSWTNYTTCTGSEEGGVEDSPALQVLFLVGFSLSTLALFVALTIFLSFRSLRCLRNIIHCHLIVSFTLSNITWLIMNNALIAEHRSGLQWLCKLKVTLYRYLTATNFFWMFVEGLYLFSMIVWAFSASKIKHWHYIIVGWMLPVVFVAVWVILKLLYDDTSLCWLPHSDAVLDYIIHIPICIVLLCNVFFLATIIWVLVTKLRASNSLETRQYRKAVRATVVLFPLLGLTYLLFFYIPTSHRHLYHVTAFVNAALHSLQGLVVAIFFCFLNGEVQAVLRKKLSNIQDNRGLFTRYTKSSFVGSPGRSSFHALSMTTCNGRQSQPARSKHCNSETSEVFASPEEAAEHML
ncbi:corticotropin-releasing factor receptor 1-like isoform X2 [Pomacea canaliculata]|uniref:corticotropin-releasing factor receptor 1-like isoform X2 n=1 Tax=Pomacea canaliculata TaxID=400727 RepID=UPI000D736CD9|nr:corticotropin-releasing factor receptor 1-like isoform X2 [Pomacea canaliculata]XP_025093534.1 corticotropin-releasing factor receptor 1-like isoform X2 [Pomacea canaliculata]XP_025093535.1 corticotropin-releasing factor receptor 1-like isoform X2 [Pomacea canaliculata]XP_025093536.1 corticotropin-releasing factor receptor 1-like isoform X2 [Pomacea canaliculata]XP_025093537.1 corticotropin-releasing factor receptor 1-like isoform X2 [Pomacea canaliculata]